MTDRHTEEATALVFGPGWQGLAGRGYSSARAAVLRAVRDRVAERLRADAEKVKDLESGLSHLRNNLVDFNDKPVAWTAWHSQVAVTMIDALLRGDGGET